MRFADPIFLLLILLIFPGRLLLKKFFKPKETSIRFSFPPFANLKAQKSIIGRIPQTLEAIALILLIIALARPQSMDSKVRRSVFGIDIILALDLSQSMLIEDFQPKNRMVAAKQIITNFIKKRENDRIGLVVFSGNAYTASPLTNDTKLLLQSLDMASPDDLKSGTAIGVAIATSIARLEKVTGKSKIIILCTDGDNNAGAMDPITAASLAADNRIKIYSIGMGTEGLAPMPVPGVDVFGRKTTRYEMVKSSIDNQTLNKLAELTGGKFFRANSSGTLEKIFQEIDRLEKTKVELNEYVRYNEHFQDFIRIALLLLVFALTLRFFFVRSIP